MDGKDVALVPVKDGNFESVLMGRKTEYPPRHEDKEDLLRQLFLSAQEMEKSGAGVKDIALMASTAINAIHSFMDGNGRTSRLFYYLLSENFSGTEEQIAYLKKILGDKGRLFINNDPKAAKEAINEYIIKSELGLRDNDPKYISTQIDEDLIALKLSPDLQKKFSIYIEGEGGDFGFFAVYKYLKDTNRLDEFIIRRSLPNGQPGISRINLKDILNKLKEDDFRGILNTYWDLKKKGVSILMDSLAHPENYAVDLKNGRTTIKTEFLKNIDKAMMRSSQEVNFQNIEGIWPELESLPYKQEKIPAEEMNAIQEIYQKAKEITKKDKEERVQLNFNFKEADEEVSRMGERQYEYSEDDPDYDAKVQKLMSEVEDKERELYRPLIEISERNLAELIEYIERFNIWKHKFATRKEQYGLTPEQCEATDSIYYVTNSGVSLRLLRYSLAKGGLKIAIQPFFEKCYFVADAESDISEEPEVGLRIIEYATDEFFAAQDQQKVAGDFGSRIRMYKKDGKLFIINPVDGNQHISYPINRIF